MTNTVMVFKDKTLGEGDDGTVQCVEAAATITLPHEDTWKFRKNDEFEIVSNTDATVKVVGADKVKVIPLSNAAITAKGSSVKIKYEGENVYLMR